MAYTYIPGLEGVNQKAWRQSKSNLGSHSVRASEMARLVLAAEPEELGCVPETLWDERAALDGLF